MTTYAREVLEDCKQALLEIEDGVMGRQCRIRWVAAVTLLRTVGYVLEKVDGSNDLILKRLIDKKWDNLKMTRPEPLIFWRFIDTERNNILKEYKVNAGQSVTIRPGILSINLATGQQANGPSGPTTYSYHINEGYYKGRHQREVIQEAIDWWEQYLEQIDKEYITQKSFA